MVRGQMTIGDAARLLEVGGHTIRRLEDLGRIPPAKRDRLSGRRVYTAEDVEALRDRLRQLGGEI